MRFPSRLTKCAARLHDALRAAKTLQDGGFRLIDFALFPERLAQLSFDVGRYIVDQRERYRGAAAPLSVEQVSAMRRHFSSELLCAVRVKQLMDERLETPRFHLIELDDMTTIALSLMAAITFSDVIVANVPLDNELLFHELVHAEQYRQLGVPGFAKAYVKGALEQGSYHGIPLEEQAYMLGARFVLNPEETFPVADEVAAWVSERRF